MTRPITLTIPLKLSPSFMPKSGLIAATIPKHATVFFMKGVQHHTVPTRKQPKLCHGIGIIAHNDVQHSAKVDTTSSKTVDEQGATPEGFGEARFADVRIYDAANYYLRRHQLLSTGAEFFYCSFIPQNPHFSLKNQNKFAHSIFFYYLCALVGAKDVFMNFLSNYL